MCFLGEGDGTEEASEGDLLESGPASRDVDTLIAWPSWGNEPACVNEGEIRITNYPAGLAVGWWLETNSPPQAIRRFGESRYGRPGRYVGV
jgi:hypothetical protein